MGRIVRDLSGIGVIQGEAAVQTVRDMQGILTMRDMPNDLPVQGGGSLPILTVVGDNHIIPNGQSFWQGRL